MANDPQVTTIQGTDNAVGIDPEIIFSLLPYYDPNGFPLEGGVALELSCDDDDPTDDPGGFYKPNCGAGLHYIESLSLTEPLNIKTYTLSWEEIDDPSPTDTMLASEQDNEFIESVYPKEDVFIPYGDSASVEFEHKYKGPQHEDEYLPVPTDWSVTEGVSIVGESLNQDRIVVSVFGADAAPDETPTPAGSYAVMTDCECSDRYIHVVKVHSVKANDVESLEGDEKVVYVEYTEDADENSTTEIRLDATPYPDVAWPSGFPKWTLEYNDGDPFVPEDAQGDSCNGQDNFTYIASAPGKYVFTAKCGDNGNAVKVTNYVVKVDLDVDTDRDGSVEDDEDEDGEDGFTRAKGAVVIVNGDRDNGGTDADNSDTVVNGNNDTEDLSRIVIRRSGLSSLPSGIQAVLRINNNQAEMIRIFKKPTEGEDEILGASAGTGNGDYKECTLDASWITGTEDAWELGAEALRFSGEFYYEINEYGTYDAKTAPTDGMITICLVYQKEESPGTWVDLESDEVVLQIAPAVFSWNGQEADKIYATKTRIIYEDIDDQIRNNTETTVEEVYIDFEIPGINEYDPFVQDYFEIINTGRNSEHNISFIADVLHHDSNNHDIADELFQNENTYGKIILPHGGNGGDIETTPKLANYQFGRVVEGNKHSPSIASFVDANKVQAPVIVLDVTWLDVGHVDEIVSFVPKEGGWAVLVPSPSLAVDELHKLVTNGHGNVTIQCGTKEEDTYNYTIEQLLIEKRDNLFAKTTIIEDINEASTEIKLSDAKFENDDYLRIGNEYVKVRFGGGTTRITVERALSDFPSSSAAAHNEGSIIYCLSSMALRNIYKHKVDLDVWEDGAQKRINTSLNAFYSDLGGNIDVRCLPVLFDRIGRDNWAAFTPNFVNCLIADGKAFMTRSEGPSVPGENQNKTLGSALEIRLYKGMRV